MSNFFSDEENYPSIKSDTVDNQDAGDPESSPRQQTIRECVSSSLSDYLSRVDPDNVSNLYELVLSEVEAPLLETVMQYTRSNQSKATTMLGLNRGTLRKKLKKYGMLN